MSLPVGSYDPFKDPIPSTSSQALEELDTANKVQRTFELLKNLLDTTEKRDSSPKTGSVQALLEEQYDSIVIDAAKRQIIRLIQETSQNCLQIAKTLVNREICLEQRLQESHLLTRQELASIKISLKELCEKQSPVQQTKSEKQKSLPLKKRTYKEAFLPEEDLLPKKISYSPEVTLRLSNSSLETVFALLDMVKDNKGWGTKDFTCSTHTPSGCATCSPIQHLMTTEKSTKEMQLRRQLCVLLEYTSREALAKCLHENRHILASILGGACLPNHHLAFIIDQCQIDDDICLPDTPNPKSQAQIYKYMEEIISAGVESAFVKGIRSVWKTTKMFQIADALTITSEYDTNHEEILTKTSFLDALPKLQKTYFFTSKGRKSKNHADAAYSLPFGLFLTQATFATAQAILHNPSSAFLLTKTSLGKPLPTLTLLLRILSLILSLHTKWKLRLLPCKASVKARSYLHFNDADSEALENDFLSFTKENEIKMSGSNYSKKKPQPKKQ
ncbi:hypothetical protein [Chlamydiifrater volucris]|uniref:hypothetical protein n=1 Tax=Chlamydiifrater volucris TaxID=2681470 RepID=UPI001BCF45F0|nr:hypothetical protein [Chlamydiifrater volucris]